MQALVSVAIEGLERMRASGNLWSRQASRRWDTQVDARRRESGKGSRL